MGRFLLSLTSVTPAGVGVGLLTAFAAKRWARPLAVETLTAGYRLKDGTERVLADARAAAAGVAADARKAAERQESEGKAEAAS